MQVHHGSPTQATAPPATRPVTDKTRTTSDSCLESVPSIEEADRVQRQQHEDHTQSGIEKADRVKHQHHEDHPQSEQPLRTEELMDRQPCPNMFGSKRT